MSDALRQSTTDKAASNLKPDSQKSTLEQGSDKVKGAADSVAGSAQPEGEKGVGQKATDATSGSGSSGKPVTEQASDMAGNAANTVKDTLGMNK